MRIAVKRFNRNAWPDARQFLVNSPVPIGFFSNLALTLLVMTLHCTNALFVYFALLKTLGIDVD